MSSPRLTSILLIDDDEISNLFNQIFIGKLEIDVAVDVVLNGEEAISYIKENILLPDLTQSNSYLLLLDIRMPVMDGWEFLEAYDKLVDNKTKERITIVMLTTSEDEGDFVQAFKNPNIKHVIKKPLSETKFEMLIKKFFSNENMV